MSDKTPQPVPQAQHDEVPKGRLDRLIYRLGNVLSLLFIATAAISFYEVVMRYLFNAPTMWVHETASFVGGALFVFGGAYALATNKHVRVVLIYDSVSQSTRHYLNLFHHVMGLVFTGLLSYAAYHMAEESWFAPWGELRLETSGSFWNPAFPAYTKALIFFILMVMFVQFALHLIAEVRDMKRGRNV